MVLVLKLRLRNVLMLEQCIKRHQENDLDRKCILITQYLDTKGIEKFHIDEKLGIRFRKMQKCKVIHILHFLRKEVKNLFNAGFERIWNLYTFRKLRYWFSSLIAIKTIFTQQPNLEISWMIYKNNLNIQCSIVADKMKLFSCHGNQIRLVTKKILFLGKEVFVYQIWAFYVSKWLR